MDPRIIERGAFVATIRDNGHRVKLLWQHKDDEPIGRPVEMRENQDGLFIKGKIADTPRGREAMGLLSEGVIDEMSIGFDPVKHDYRDGQHRRIRHITHLRLWEVSLVTWGANPNARVTGVMPNPDAHRRADSPSLRLMDAQLWAARGRQLAQASRALRRC